VENHAKLAEVFDNVPELPKMAKGQFPSEATLKKFMKT
jgi:hypothetical protein